MEPQKESEKKAEKIEKVSGYTLLVIGLVFIIIPVLLLLWMFLSGTLFPQLIPVPTGDSEGFAKALASFSNVCLIFFIFLVIVWSGSIITSRGVTLIKDVKMHLMRKSLKEVAEFADKVEAET
jgi:TRAP-type C4-dicarboxylate transport system permease small subunit